MFHNHTLLDAVRVPLVGAPPPDADMLAWAANITANFGITVSGLTKTRVNDLIVGLKADGVWDKIDVIWLFASDNTNYQQTVVDLKTRGQIAGIGTITQSAAGWTGDGTTGYIRTQFTPSVDGVNWTATSFHMAASIQNSRTTNLDHEACGVALSSIDTSVRLLPLSSFFPGKLAWNAQTAVNSYAANTSPTNAKGLYVVTLSTPTSQAIYKNGNTTPVDTDTKPCSGLPTSGVYVLALNFGDSPLGFSADTVGFFCCGGTLTAAQAASLASRVNTYLTAWGVPAY
jgi:hypothetical protein